MSIAELIYPHACIYSTDQFHITGVLLDTSLYQTTLLPTNRPSQPGNISEKPAVPKTKPKSFKNKWVDQHETLYKKRTYIAYNVHVVCHHHVSSGDIRSFDPRQACWVTTRMGDRYLLVILLEKHWWHHQDPEYIIKQPQAQINILIGSIL